jgi:DNA-binding XRE family transcriptional regulator
MRGLSTSERAAYPERAGEAEAARKRGAIMAVQWGHELAQERRRLGRTQAGLADLMGVTPGRVSQIERGEVATVEAIAAYVIALGGTLDLLVNLGGHLLKMPATPSSAT